MIIKNLKINNFGKLENKEIPLKENINIIYGKNESGKSTIQKFIISMLYGISKNKCGKFIPDFERFSPWIGDEFSGRIGYVLDNGESYEVFRDFKKKNPKIFNNQMEDISNTFNIDKTNGSQFFYEQTKIDEQLFLNTFFSEQEQVKLGEKEQTNLVQKITNLVGTGNDNVSFNKVIAKLNKKQLEEIGTRKSQDRPINIVEKQLEEIKQEKLNLDEFKVNQNEIEQNINKKEKEIKQNEQKIEILEKIQKIKENEIIENAKIRNNEDLIKNYDEKIEQIQEKIKIRENNFKTNENKNSNFKIFLIIAIILIILSIPLFIFVNNKIPAIITILCSIISIIMYGYKQSMNNKLIKNNQNEKNVEIYKLENEKELIENEKAKLKNQLVQQKENLKNIINQEISNINASFSLYELQQMYENEEYLKLSTYRQILNDEKLKLHTMNIDKQAIINKLDKLASIEEQQSKLQERFDELTYLSGCIEIAKSEIEIAYNSMKQTITPQYTKNLSNIMSKISNGKYQNVTFNDEQGIIVETKKGDYVLAKTLSIGTIDQLYLSLRLSAAKEISSEKLPIILDEAFAYYDDERLTNILEFLAKEYGNRQIIIFTCTNREKQILNKCDIEFNYIEI